MSKITITLKPVSLKDGTREMFVFTNDIIGDKINEIRNLFGYSELHEIKVIYSGKVLKYEDSFEQSGIVSNTSIVIMATVKKITKQEPILNTVQQTEKTQQTKESTKSTQPIQSTESIRSIESIQPNEPIKQNPIFYWDKPIPVEDTQPTYSFEQIYAIVPQFTNFIMNTILNDPNLSMDLFSGKIGSVMSEPHNPTYENFLRQLLDQSQSLANSVKNGQVPEVRIMINPVTHQFLPGAGGSKNKNSNNDTNLSLPLPLPPLSELSDLHNDNNELNNFQNQLQQLSLALEGQNSANILSQLMSGQLGATTPNNNSEMINTNNTNQSTSTNTANQSTPTNNTNQFTTDDEAIIDNLMAITGVPKEVIISFYLSCDRDPDLTYQLLLGSLN